MIGDLVKSLVAPIIEPLVERIPDPNERARAREAAEQQMIAAMTGLVEGQLKINMKEAEHGSVFVAGWRPGIGWICGVALGWNFVLQPIMAWVGFVLGYDLSTAPELDTSELTTILLGMLGLGGLRTYEKRVGVARKSLGKNK